jgi:hypothetical protein
VSAERQARYRARLAAREGAKDAEIARLHRRVAELEAALARAVECKQRNVTPPHANGDPTVTLRSGPRLSAADLSRLARFKNAENIVLAHQEARYELRSAQAYLEQLRLLEVRKEAAPLFIGAPSPRWTTQRALDHAQERIAEAEARVALFDRWVAAGRPEARSVKRTEQSAKLAELRKAMQREHPDKGGDTGAFIKVKKEYDRIRRGGRPAGVSS